MTNYWPATWNSAFTDAFTGPRSQLSVQIVFIGSDGKQHGEQLDFFAPVPVLIPSGSDNTDTSRAK